MKQEIDARSVEELKRGFTAAEGVYTCWVCGAEFHAGEVYPMEGKFYEAGRAAEEHRRICHGSMLEILTDGEQKYGTLTENQRELLLKMASGLTDGEIAAQLGLAASTVRHQRFQFRERAKQARLYLAVYELAAAGFSQKGARMVEARPGARMVDERYQTTEEEQEKILNAVFSSQSPLRLKVLSAKEKKKVVILRRVAREFRPGRRYTEPEVNALLEGIYGDYATLRRYLIEYGFLERTRDCREYWIPEKERENHA